MAFGNLEFEGFVAVRELEKCDCNCVPPLPGVYQVFLPHSEKPRFLDQSPAGRFKGRDPTVSRDILDRHWVDGVRCLYIGKAGSPRGNTTLRSRIRQFVRFGSGEPVGHWGGRLVWQLRGARDLVVCWRATGREAPVEVERKLLLQFLREYRRLPFANLRMA